MEKILFDLEDIKPQLTEKQIKELEHIIYMAKELKEQPQLVQFGEQGKKIIVYPSGKMQHYPEEPDKTCPTCKGEGKIKEENFKKIGE